MEGGLGSRTATHLERFVGLNNFVSSYSGAILSILGIGAVSLILAKRATIPLETGEFP